MMNSNGGYIVGKVILVMENLKEECYLRRWDCYSEDG